MQPQDILTTAAQLVGERGQTRDCDDRRTMEDIVTLFNVLTNRHLHPGQSLSEDDGWAFMQCVKLVRLQRAPGEDIDSVVDLAAYTALRGEARARRAYAKR